jgi:hypothetical protein
VSLKHSHYIDPRDKPCHHGDVLFREPEMPLETALAIVRKVRDASEQHNDLPHLVGNRKTLNCVLNAFPQPTPRIVDEFTVVSVVEGRELWIVDSLPDGMVWLSIPGGQSVLIDLRQEVQP